MIELPRDHRARASGPPDPSMSERRFPSPWSAEVTPNCFIVRDANGQALSYRAPHPFEGAKT
jgi:hypothetical protein